MNNPSRRYLAVLVLLSFFTGVTSQVLSVNAGQLASALKKEATDDITQKLNSAIENTIQSTEKKLIEDYYINIMLEPLEPFGVDPNDPKIVDNARSIYNEIKAEMEKDPSLSASVLLKGKIKGLVETGLMNYAGTFIDQESKDIYEQVSNLYSDGKDQMNRLIKAYEGISVQDPASPDYVTRVTATLKKYGIKSDYFYTIDKVEKYIGNGAKKVLHYKEEIIALYSIKDAFLSNSPTDKIVILFQIGEQFGGRVPVIGALISNLFTVANGVLAEANKLQGVIDKNLGQGCIARTGGYGITMNKKMQSFLNKFQNVERICPLKQKPYSPVYNNIYFEEGNESQLFFYLKNNWLRGKKDDLHAGTTDIQGMIRWLRNNQLADKAGNLEFMFTAYQKEYGITAYSKAINEKLSEIIRLFNKTYLTIGFCNNNAVKDYFMVRVGLGWFTKLLSPTGEVLDWEAIKHFSPELEQKIKNRMIYNYYVSKHKHNLGHFDRMITNFKENLPVHFYGHVTFDNGTPISDVVINTGRNVVFPITDKKCQKYITDQNGYFSWFHYFKQNENIIVISGGSKVNGDIKVKSQEVRLDLENSLEYKVNLFAPLPDNTDSSSTAVSSSSGNSSVNTSSGSSTADIATLISQAPCANDPNAIAEWDDTQQKVICSCIENYIWDASKQKCVQDINAILANSDCSQYPNTEAKWDYDNNEAYCDCKPGYVWDETDYTRGCISEKQQILAQTDCSQYGHAQAVWDEANQNATCDCEPGYVWNDAGTECISENQALLAQIDCSQFPNTEPKWDDATKQGYCDCKPGYEWNDDYTECIKTATQQNYDNYCPTPNTQPVWDNVLQQMVCDCKPGYRWSKDHTECIPEKHKPSINWNNVLNITAGVVQALYNGQNPLMPGVQMPGTSGGGVGVAQQQPTVSRNNCNDKVEEGTDAPEVHIIDLGRSYGRFEVYYSMHIIKDEIIVSQGGRVIYDSGCVSGSNTVQLDLNGFSREIQVRINPNCEGTKGTKWEFTVHCPQ